MGAVIGYAIGYIMGGFFVYLALKDKIGDA